MGGDLSFYINVPFDFTIDHREFKLYHLTLCSQKVSPIGHLTRQLRVTPIGWRSTGPLWYTLKIMLPDGTPAFIGTPDLNWLMLQRGL